MDRSCPFHSDLYASGLDRLGEVRRGARSGFPIFQRPIPGTDRADGVGPWPYMWVGGPQDIAALREDFRDLVTIAAVTQPGYVPCGAAASASLLKVHFVYDPRRPAPELSRRSRLRLARCEDRATFDPVESFEGRMRMADIHARLIGRRGLRGSYVDFPREHFAAIAGLDAAAFFEVRDAQGIGAMACGVVFAGMLQVLHMASTDEGLHWNASYLLMAGLQRYVRTHGLRLLTGGMPDAGTAGLQRFKQRWANHAEPVYLLRIVNDEAAYADLCGRGAAAADFFPAYRAPSAARAAAPSEPQYA